MTNPTEITAIITTHNRGNLVANAINSVLNQTFKDFDTYKITKNTYTVHLFGKSWNPKDRKFAKLFHIGKIIGEKWYLDFMWRVYTSRKNNKG